jgi:molybdopterin/thiamine biosynthesis adenylyltransferase
MSWEKNQDRQLSHIPQLDSRIQAESSVENHPSGRAFSVLTEEKARSLSRAFKCSLRQVSVQAMEQGIILKRYLRNLESLDIADQLELARSKAAVIGAGGLGGQVILTLARLGIGEIQVIDPDVFDETNLNRQVLCTVHTLGLSKARTAVEAVSSINPSVEVAGHKQRFSRENGRNLLSGAQVAVDCLDSVQDRFVLQDCAKDLGIPLVHAAIDGFLAQVMTIYPRDPGLEELYSRKRKERPSPSGNPVFAPGVAALFQAMEVMKVILGRGELIHKRLLFMDLEACRLNHVPLSGHESDMLST